MQHSTCIINPALFDAYAECGARIDCHMRRFGVMGSLTDSRAIAYLIKKFVKQGPTIKMIIPPQNGYKFLSVVRNTVCLVNWDLNRALIYDGDNAREVFVNGRLQSIVEFNGQLAARTRDFDIIAFNGDILKKYQYNREFTWRGLFIIFRGVCYQLKHDAKDYLNISYQSGFIKTLFRLNMVEYHDIYDVSKLNAQMQNQPIIEFQMPAHRNFANIPHLYTVNGLIYMVTNGYIIVISLTDCCMLWEISHEKVTNTPWVKAPWTNITYSNIKDNGNLVFMDSTRTVYELQM